MKVNPISIVGVDPLIRRVEIIGVDADKLLLVLSTTTACCCTFSDKVERLFGHDQIAIVLEGEIFSYILLQYGSVGVIRLAEM